MKRSKISLEYVNHSNSTQCENFNQNYNYFSERQNRTGNRDIANSTGQLWTVKIGR